MFPLMPDAAREIDNLCGFPTLLKAKLFYSAAPSPTQWWWCWGWWWWYALMMMGMTAMIDQIYQFLKHKHKHLSYFHIVSSHILLRSLYHTIMIVWKYSGTGRVFMYSQKTWVSPNRLFSSRYQDHRAIFSGDECAWKMFLAQLTSNYFMHM